MKILDVTALVINIGTIEPIIELLDKTRKTIEGHFEFKKYVIITDKPVTHDLYEIKYAPPMDYKGRNLFCIEQLYKYFDTPHCLMLQPDGFIIHPELWDDYWLNFDYVAAPWEDYSIGCGGFSLRSKKLAFHVFERFGSHYNPGYNEDWYYSNNVIKDSFIRYPSYMEAMRFCQETTFDDTITPFGVHDSKRPESSYKYWLNKLNNND